MTTDEQIGQLDSWLCGVNDALLGRSRPTRPRRVRWWTSELDQMRRSVRRLRKRFQRVGQSDVEERARRGAVYRASLREYKDRILEVKEAEWREFVRQNRDDPWGTVYRICAGRNRDLVVEGIRVDGGSTVTAWDECMGALMAVFFPVVEGVGSPPLIREGAVPPALLGSEISDSICKVRSRKSPGLDGMTGEMCKSIWKAMPEYLESVFAKCLSEGYFPEAWKKARVVVLLKSPDKDRSDPSSYRGISLLPVLGKVLERIMVTRLKECEGAALSDFQFGFREGRSVEDAWIHVKSCVATSEAKYVLGIFVDFKGAFDHLIWSAVLDRLRSVGCRELALWRSYFSGRKACVVGAGGTVWRNVVRGCPQGSICGPFIWNLMMDSLLRQLQHEFKLCAYADDLLILVEGRSRADLENLGERAMRVVSEWGQGVGVEVAMGKTVTMLLKGRLSRGRPPLIRSGGISLRYETQVKYLGIMVGERLNFLVHLSYVREKLTAVVGKVRRILRSDWGLSRRATRTIYGGLFVACAAYGSPVWYETVMSVAGQANIMKCQRVAMLACMPVCRTVSTDALQVLLGRPLDLEVIRRAITFKVRKGLPLSPHDWISAQDLVDNRTPVQIKALLWERLVTVWRDRPAGLWLQPQSWIFADWTWFHECVFACPGDLGHGFVCVWSWS
ncbi:Putative 115 kDa protein in type-1 retrotransposable element R1DM [Eumeta japonica]|uniref:115 kDa protein in type-1 retrotransposable element R1DM n=1 Tax=Eumeta variegata TaxID=151549 RepID=A0A4C1ZU27_EUMVA|nr:Putative 115 kDa protein in type-1 retrotransposable element R1DM [Eumeta japonica]